MGLDLFGIWDTKINGEYIQNICIIYVIFEDGVRAPSGESSQTLSDYFPIIYMKRMRNEMGFFCFLFQVKLVDVEKVEWLNRRSYSAISLFLGREGRVLLRSEHGLEDWFELLEVSVGRRTNRMPESPDSIAFNILFSFI